MADSPNLKRLLRFTPFTWEQLLGVALSHVLTRQDPEKIEFKKRNDSYAIVVETDEDSIELAADFFQEYVAPEIDKRQ